MTLHQNKQNISFLSETFWRTQKKEVEGQSWPPGLSLGSAGVDSLTETALKYNTLS